MGSDVSFWAKAKWRLGGILRPKLLDIRRVCFRNVEFMVLANEDVGWRIIWGGGYENADLVALESLIKPTDVCVDVGANIGIYSVFMGLAACEVSVFSYEPVLLNRRLLELNATLNQLDNIKVRTCALSDTSGVTDFSVSEDGAYSSMMDTGRKPCNKSIQIQTSSLDDEFPDGKVDLIKIDVEGAELKVLQGARKLLSDKTRRPRALFVELSNRNLEIYGNTTEEVVHFMEELGYQAYSIIASGISKGWPTLHASENAVFMHTDYGDR